MSSKGHERYRTFFKSDLLSSLYVQYRPRYDQCLFEKIVDFCHQTNAGHDQVAVDVGCGPGQSTLPLTKYFNQVIGVDVSREQIAHAPKDVPGVEFRVGRGEDLQFIQSGSVDLVTVGTAFHWLQLEEFYREVDRILRPGGALVAYSYNVHGIAIGENDPCYMGKLASELIAYHDESTHVNMDTQYSHMDPPFDGWKWLEDSTMTRHWTVQRILQFITSMSVLYAFQADHPNRCFIDEARLELCQRFSISPQDVDNPKKKLKVAFPMFILGVHKPTRTHT